MSDRQLSTVAVVVVHGIGDQRSKSSARSVADLLLRLRANQNSQYTTFSEKQIRVPVRPAHVGPAGGSDTIEHRFMRDQLEEYASSGEPYETIRLDGQRLAEDNAGDMSPHADVHIYEMHWADLTRLPGRFLSVFGELYQLFFHVANLGRLAVDHAAAEHPGDRGWRAYHRAHGLAVQILTMVVPALFLTTLATITGLVALGIPLGAKPIVVTALATLAVAGGGALAVYRAGWARSAVAWLSVPALAIVAAVVTYRFAQGETHQLHLDRLLLVAWIALFGAALNPVYRAYNRRNPGVFRIGMGFYLVSAMALLALVPMAQSPETLRNRVLNVFEAEMLAAIMVWGVFYASGALAGLLGWQVAAGLEGAARGRASRAAWTARVTLALSSTSVLVVSFVAWAALVAAYGGRLPQEKPTLLFDFFGPAENYADVFDQVIRVTAGPGLPVVLVLTAAILVVTILALIPAVMREIRAPEVGHTFRERSTRQGTSAADAWAKQAMDDNGAERLGRWLSTGLGVTAAGFLVQYAALFYALPVMNLIQLATQGSIAAFTALQSSAANFILGAGAFVAGAQVGAIAISGWVSANSFGFRTMLDALLDVDSYLRRHPRDATPRARIAERFTSLLRYINHWRGEKYGYKAVIFVTHSQGTVITADLLNYLQSEEDDELGFVKSRDRGEPPPWTMARMYLMTMGSPLRDLYSFAFPHLFDWVRTARPLSVPSGFTRQEIRPLEERLDNGRRVVGPAIPIAAAPDPYNLGVARWVNAYRSGDYVGRSLWRAAMPEAQASWLRAAPSDAQSRYPDDEPPIVYVSEDVVGSRRELCIGAGGHTHYWDESAKAIALELDSLIDSALALPVLPGPAAREYAVKSGA
jgi:hypothetical protein